MVEYPHTLSKGILRGLVKVIRARGPYDRFHISVCDLTYSERENLRKLQYWGIIERVKSEGPKGGWWLLTVRGMDFAKGIISLPKKVWTYRGKVQRYEGNHVFITEITGGWKYRPDYAREAVPH